LHANPNEPEEIKKETEMEMEMEKDCVSRYVFIKLAIRLRAAHVNWAKTLAH